MIGVTVARFEGVDFSYPPAELSVGIITSFFGAPFFVYLLRTRRGLL